MDTFECIKNRVSVRSFTNEPLTREDLMLIAKAGLEAPTAMNSRDIVLTVLQGESLKKVVDAMEIAMGEDKKRFFRGGKFDFHRGGDALIVVSLGKKSIFPEQNVGCIMENMYLEATELGLGSCWINQFYNYSDKKICDLLNLSDGYRPYAALSVGHIDKKPEKPIRDGQIIFLD